MTCKVLTADACDAASSWKERFEGVLAQEGGQRHARQQPQVMPARPDRPLRHAQLPAPDTNSVGFSGFDSGF